MSANQRVADLVIERAERTQRFLAVAAAGPDQMADAMKARGPHQYKLFHNGMVSAVRALRDGAWVWVTEDMAELTRHSAPTLPEFRLQPEDLPWPSALVFFESPLFHVTDGGLTLPVGGLCWASDPGGVGLTTLAPINGHYIPQIFTTWPYGDPIMSEYDPPEFEEPHRAVATLWVLLRQRVAVLSSAGPASRGAGRRLSRSLPERDPNSINVVTLRRPKVQENGDGPGRHVEWSHRWLVDGHWRQQWYPSIEDHRPVWIAPHVKGPDSKPLVTKDKVYAWKR